MKNVNTSVNGSTEVYAVIGCPISHSFSPVIHNTMAERLGRNFIYTALKVEPDALEDAIKGAYALGIRGINVTVPHKKAVMDMLCSVDKRALAVGAVNTLKYTENGYEGYNTDVIGAYYALKNAGYDIRDKAVLLTGAGGAGNACAVMACDSGCKSLTIANRTVEKADELADNLRKHYSCDINTIKLDDIYSLEKCDIIINATTLGFGDKRALTPIEDRSFFKDKGVEFVFDVIYPKTRLLSEAEEEGIPTLAGFDMLVYQALAAEEIWFGEKFDIDTQREICALLWEYYKENM